MNNVPVVFQSDLSKVGEHLKGILLSHIVQAQVQPIESVVGVSLKYPRKHDLSDCSTMSIMCQMIVRTLQTNVEGKYTHTQVATRV